MKKRAKHRKNRRTTELMLSMRVCVYASAIHEHVAIIWQDNKLERVDCIILDLSHFRFISGQISGEREHFFVNYSLLFASNAYSVLYAKFEGIFLVYEYVGCVERWQKCWGLIYVIFLLFFSRFWGPKKKTKKNKEIVYTRVHFA